MKIILMVVGKTLTESLAGEIEKYARRITHYLPFEIKVIPDVKKGKTFDPVRQKTAEGELILKEIERPDTVILLDERGREMTSREFATFVDKKVSVQARNIFFIVGGPYGFSDDVYNRADSMMSLSKMTFPHEMARLFFVEQLYRAMTILRGEPYHHD